jgi:hypothetical protein
VRASPELADLRKQIAAEPAEFMGFSATTVDGLFRRNSRLREQTVELTLKVSQVVNDEQRAQFQAQLQQVQRNRGVVEVCVRWVLALGHAWLARASPRIVAEVGEWIGGGQGRAADRVDDDVETS